MSDSEGAARSRRRRLRESGAPDLFMDLDSDSEDEAAGAEAPPGHEQVPAALRARPRSPTEQAGRSAGLPSLRVCLIAEPADHARKGHSQVARPAVVCLFLGRWVRSRQRLGQVLARACGRWELRLTARRGPAGGPRSARGRAAAAARPGERAPCRTCCPLVLCRHWAQGTSPVHHAHGRACQGASACPAWRSEQAFLACMGKWGHPHCPHHAIGR